MSKVVPARAQTAVAMAAEQIMKCKIFRIFGVA